MDKTQKKIVIRIILSIILSVIIYLLPIDGVWLLVAFALPYLIAGYDVLWSAIRNIFHGQVFDENFLMSIATLGAFVIKQYPEAAAVMIFYQVGELFESLAVEKSRKSIAQLMNIKPDFAVVLRDDVQVKIPPEDVMVGETIIIKAGEKIPLDGTITEGQTSINTSALTGESLPCDVAVGDRVISGSINISGLIKVRTESVYSESTVAKILELVENSAQEKAKIENFITRFARYYTPFVVLAAVLLAVLPPLLFSQEWSVWLNRALIFLVVSCPCALVVSVPLTFFGGIGGASREGILIKGANYLQALSKIDTVVFDKTGTLTKGSFAVNDIRPSHISKEDLLDIAAHAESYSNHPIAQSITKAYSGKIDKNRVEKITELAGMGIEATIDGKTHYVGNGSLMDKVGATWQESHMYGTIIHISNEKMYLGHIVCNDEVKPDSKKAIKELKSLGIKKTVMLTGDIDSVARAVGEEVGIDVVYSRLLPAQKVEQVEKLIAQGHKVAFVGDGINDSPVLTRADVGIAMGAMGSDAAIESADIVLMDDKISKLPIALKMSRKTMRIVKQNIFFALFTKGIILILGAMGIANMWVAVFGDVGVAVLAVLNAMRGMKR